MKRKRKFIYFVIGVGLCTIAFVIFSAGLPADHAEKSSVVSFKFPVTQPVVMDTAYSVDYVADIQAKKYVELKARVGGYLENIYVDEGQSVKRGQLLFAINNLIYKAEAQKAAALLKSAIAEAKTAEVELKNVIELVNNNVISETELEMARSKLEGLKAKIDEAKSDEETARLTLAYAGIKAPFDGTIGRIRNKMGTLVDEGVLLTTISDNANVYAYFNVSETEYLDIIGNPNDNEQRVSLIMANNQVYPIPGKIENMDNRIDKGTGNMSFRASFPNPDRLLKEGATGKIRIRKEIKDAVLIPQKATFDVQDKIFVFALDENDVITRKAIVPSFRLPNLYVLESGLSTSDRIIYEGIQRVRDGDKVDFEVVSFLPEKQGEPMASLSKK